jgi:hypothetical protein
VLGLVLRRVVMWRWELCVVVVEVRELGLLLLLLSRLVRSGDVL